MTKDSIALIGFMATGKTSVGKALVEYLGKSYTFVETDQIIVQDFGKSIQKIFAEEGESKFREYEIETCKKASKFKKAIISCGGGIVLNEANVENLKQNCHMVLLKASVEEIYKRAMKAGKEKRPVIDKENPKAEIEKLLKYREPFYNKSADIVIDTSGKKIKDIVKEIVEKSKLM